jgi:hypothetical protein
MLCLALAITLSTGLNRHRFVGIAGPYLSYNLGFSGAFDLAQHVRDGGCLIGGQSERRHARDY